MHTIQYSSSRLEVWHWYWRQWAKPRGFWVYHVSFGIFGGALARDYAPASLKNPEWFFLASIVTFLLCVALFPLWPQIKFKKAVRTLAINKNGVETTVGDVSGSRAWSEIADITDRGHEIIIR